MIFIRLATVVNAGTVVQHQEQQQQEQQQQHQRVAD